MIALALAIAAAPGCTFRGPAGKDDASMGDGPPPDGPIVIGDASNDWWDPAWTFRRKITIKNGELTGPVQSFPLLVRLAAGVGASNGHDLRFIATDQRTVLPHELDAVDGTGSSIWVRIPDLRPTGPEPVLWVYYGNGGVPTTSSGASVFADQYVSVHHLGDYADATGHDHTASSAGPGETPTPTTGRIGGAQDFDGQNDDLLLAGEPSYDFTTSLSASAWVKRQNLDIVYQAIITKGDKSWRLHRENLTAFVGFGTTVGGANQNHFGNISIDDGNWHHVAIAFGGSRKRIYVDGQLDESVNVGPTIDQTNFAVSIGENLESQVGGRRNWDGDIDEVRISAGSRDEHWMFAEHHTVADADFVRLGDQEMR